ncbi:MAG: aminoglycoside 6-adenylyltransferase [Caldilineaceae bacterium]
MKTDFKHGTGKFGKYLPRRLEPTLWALFEKSYADADPTHTWSALEAMCDLFRQTALQIDDQFGFTYPLKTTGE